jgi:hypothetical protein
MFKKTITKKIACPKCGKIVECNGFSGEKKIIICPECKTKGFYRFLKVKREITKDEIKALLIFQLPYILVIIAILISLFIFPDGNIATLLSFIVIIPFFVFFKFDSRIPIGYALIMLVLAAITLELIKNESFANQLAIYAYWLILVGTICLIIRYIRESRA